MQKLILNIYIKIPFFLAIVSLLSAWSPQVSAEAYACTGTVTQLALPPNGVLNVSFGFQPSAAMNYQDLCSMNEDWQGIKPSTCKAIMAQLMLAYQTQRSVTMYFNTATPGNCSKQAWTPIHLYGWYWGPMLNTP